MVGETSLTCSPQNEFSGWIAPGKLSGERGRRI